MIKVIIADVIKREQEGFPEHYVIMLRDEAGERAMPIWIGSREGETIATELAEFSWPRPLTVNLLANLLQVVGAKVEQVRVETLKETTFYAIVKIRYGKKVSEVDARPSDAIALAVLTGTPIFVAEDVLERAGADIPKTANLSSARNGVESILKGIEEVQRRARKQQQKHPLTIEEVEKAKEEMIAAVFGE